MEYGQFVGPEDRALLQSGFRECTICRVQHKIGREQIPRDVGGDKQADDIFNFWYEPVRGENERKAHFCRAQIRKGMANEDNTASDYCAVGRCTASPSCTE